MSDEEDSSAGSEGSEGSESEEEELKEEATGISKEELEEDIATLLDISKYIDETRNRISSKLVAEYGGVSTEAMVAPAPAPDYVTSSAYESSDERQRAMLLDKAIMVLMNDGGGKA